MNAQDRFARSLAEIVTPKMPEKTASAQTTQEPAATKLASMSIDAITGSEDFQRGFSNRLAERMGEIEQVTNDLLG